MKSIILFLEANLLKISNDVKSVNIEAHFRGELIVYFNYIDGSSLMKNKLIDMPKEIWESYWKVGNLNDGGYTKECIKHIKKHYKLPDSPPIYFNIHDSSKEYRINRN